MCKFRLLKGSQKGQSIVEFALILPLLLLFVFSIIYFALAFTDYQTMNNTARGIAHEASLCDSIAKYSSIAQKYVSETRLVSDIYIWKPAENGTNNKYLTISYDATDSQVDVVLQADYNTEGSTIAKVMRAFSGNNPQGTVVFDYHIYSKVKD